MMLRPRTNNPDWFIFKRALREVRARYASGSDIPIAEIATAAKWTFQHAQLVAMEMTEERMIETDMGLGSPPTVVESH